MQVLGLANQRQVHAWLANERQVHGLMHEWTNPMQMRGLVLVVHVRYGWMDGWISLNSCLTRRWIGHTEKGRFVKLPTLAGHASALATDY
jgi:hypothetical protein